MQRFRFSIASLLVVVLFVAVGFAALRESSDLWESGVFTLTLAALLISILLAVHRTESRRAFWLGFAVFGWIYLGLSVVPSIESRLMTTKALTYLDSKVPGRSPASLHRFNLQGSAQSSPSGQVHRDGNQLHLQPRRPTALGCGDRQAPRRLERLNRELREDWTLAGCSACGLVRRAALSPTVATFQTARAGNGGALLTLSEPRLEASSL